jgi:hypothetical protein
MQADLINQLLPRSKFIHVIRDGRDVASSVVKEKWGPSEHFAALVTAIEATIIFALRAAHCTAIKRTVTSANTAAFAASIFSAFHAAIKAAFSSANLFA